MDQLGASSQTHQGHLTTLARLGNLKCDGATREGDFTLTPSAPPPSSGGNLVSPDCKGVKCHVLNDDARRRPVFFLLLSHTSKFPSSSSVSACEWMDIIIREATELACNSI